MAFRTPLPLEDAKLIGERYGLKVEAVHGIAGGSVNSNYELRIEGGGRVFLRIFEEQTKVTAAREAKLLDHLAAGGVPTPKPLRRIDVRGFIGSVGEKPVAVFPWIEGDSLCQKSVTPEVAFRVGSALARVHLASADFDGAPLSRFGITKLEARLESIPRAGRNEELATAVRSLTSRLEVMPRFKAPKLGVIHGDLFRDNVLWNGPDIAALLDFESASRGSPAFDLSVTLLAWCYGDDLDAELCRALVAGYQEARPVSKVERAELFHQARLAAIRFAITRITDFELRPRGSGVWKDYRRFMARLKKIEALGEEGLLTHLGLGLFPAAYFSTLTRR
jgi:homoserine kinase type II